MSNCAFLAVEWPAVDAAVTRAESHARGDPRTTCSDA